MALVLRNSLRGGRGAAYRTILGIAVGLLVWGTATALGVSAVLAASATVFTVLKVAGGAYLVFLGIQTFIALRRGNEPPEQVPRPAGSPFRQGLVTNLLNPKLAVLFTTLLPQFIGPGDPVLAKSILLVIVFVTIGLTWLLVYARLAEVVGRSRRIQRVAEAVSGTVLVALGLRLAVERG
jgi:threonine/homoserine/homoserine lactone efflux protein